MQGVQPKNRYCVGCKAKRMGSTQDVKPGEQVLPRV